MIALQWFCLVSCSILLKVFMKKNFLMHKSRADWVDEAVSMELTDYNLCWQVIRWQLYGGRKLINNFVKMTYDLWWDLSAKYPVMLLHKFLLRFPIFFCGDRKKVITRFLSFDSKQ